MRIIPLSSDILLLSTLLAGIRRAGNFDYPVDRIRSAVLRWVAHQFLFAGELLLDIAVEAARSNPHIFRPRGTLGDAVSSAANNAEQPKVSESSRGLPSAVAALSPFQLSGPAALLRDGSIESIDAVAAALAAAIAAASHQQQSHQKSPQHQQHQPSHQALSPTILGALLNAIPVYQGGATQQQPPQPQPQQYQQQQQMQSQQIQSHQPQIHTQHHSVRHSRLVTTSQAASPMFAKPPTPQMHQASHSAAVSPAITQASPDARDARVAAGDELVLLAAAASRYVDGLAPHHRGHQHQYSFPGSSPVMGGSLDPNVDDHAAASHRRYHTNEGIAVSYVGPQHRRIGNEGGVQVALAQTWNSAGQRSHMQPRGAISTGTDGSVTDAAGRALSPSGIDHRGVALGFVQSREEYEVVEGGRW